MPGDGPDHDFQGTDPGRRVYWASRFEQDLKIVGSQVEALEAKLKDLMKLLAGGLVVFLGIAGGFSLWVIGTAEKTSEKAATVAAAVEAKVDRNAEHERNERARIESNMAATQQRIEAKVDRLVDVLVERKRRK